MAAGEMALLGARRYRARAEVARLDYLRSLREASSDLPQRQLADALRISQAAVSKSLRTAREVPAVREGFSGASPYEIVQRYAAGELTREQLVDELGRWDYVPMPRTDGFDDLLIVPDGTFDEVRQGLSEGAIDAETYEEIRTRVRAHAAASVS